LNLPKIRKKLIMISKEKLKKKKTGTICKRDK
jgi:hypothetical protein